VYDIDAREAVCVATEDGSPAELSVRCALLFLTANDQSFDLNTHDEHGVKSVHQTC